MFIAVVDENFDVAEEQKKSIQASQFYNLQKARHRSANWLRRLNPYRWIKASPEVKNLPSKLVLPMQKVLVQEKSSRLDGVRTTAVSFNLFCSFCLMKFMRYRKKLLEGLGL